MRQRAAAGKGAAANRCDRLRDHNLAQVATVHKSLNVNTGHLRSRELSKDCSFFICLFSGFARICGVFDGFSMFCYSNYGFSMAVFVLQGFKGFCCRHALESERL